MTKPRVRWWVGACCLSLLAVGHWSHGAGLEEVIASLQTAEARFQNIDVAWHEEYQLGDLKYKIGAAIEVRTKAGRTVVQGELFRSDCEGQQTQVDGKATSLGEISAYDGKVTRLLEDRGTLIGNIVEGRREGSQSFNPFTIPIRRFGVMEPLSVWLVGSQAKPQHQQGRRKGKNHHKSRLEGVEEVAGLECQKVVVEYYPAGDPAKITDRRIFWLVASRNHLPVKAEAYNLLSSAELPNEQTTWEYKEIEPGIWYPTVIVHKGFDESRIREEAKGVVSWQSTFVVDSVDLHPGYEENYFRDVEFPEGTVVYHVNAAGEISKSYVEGEE